MALVATQQLATVDDFFIHGVERSRIKSEYLVADYPAINAWLRAASGKVLASFSTFMILPLLEWGDDVVKWTCELAAFQAKGVIGLPSAEGELDQLQVRYDAAILELEKMAVRRLAPQGVKDSSAVVAEDVQYPAVPRTAGYPRMKVLVP